MLEVWKQIDGFEGYYEVSSHGRVRSVERTVNYKSRKGKDAVRSYPSRVLVPSVTSEYAMYVLSISGTLHYEKGHRLVARAFLPPVLGSDYVNHKNGVKTDNRVDNLEWVTRSENALHARNVLKQQRGDAHPNAILSYSDVDKIRKRHADGETFTVIARDMGMSISAVSRAYRSWGGINV